VYQVNTRLRLRELSRRLGRPATFDDESDDDLDRLASLGVDWVWPLGVWQTGCAGREVARRQARRREDLTALLPDLSDDDILPSPFAVQGYTVHPDFGGDAALARFRERLRRRGLRLMLGFIANHTALDHPWVQEHPEYYVTGEEADLARQPGNYWRAPTRHGPRILAHGRDPNFPAWPDTAQLDYRSPALRKAVTAELTRVAGLCDGVHCAMAMLLLPDVFRGVWGDRPSPGDRTAPVDTSFWAEAIASARAAHPDCLFAAEAYWGLERPLQQDGFDYTYDKWLYDRLRERDAGAIRDLICADTERHHKSVHFLENVREPRAASVFPPEVHRAAAVITFLVPGMSLVHDGQLDGLRQWVPPYLGRRPNERPDPALRAFYLRLLECVRRPEVRDGTWRFLECRPSWERNPTWRQFVAFAWEGEGGGRVLVTVNYGYTQGQCYVRLPWSDLPGRPFVLQDFLSRVSYERDGSDLADRGLYLDVPEWHCHVFDVRPGTGTGQGAGPNLAPVSSG
jgi:hypothetical protein